MSNLERPTIGFVLGAYGTTAPEALAMLSPADGVSPVYDLGILPPAPATKSCRSSSRVSWERESCGLSSHCASSYGWSSALANIPRLMRFTGTHLEWVPAGLRQFLLLLFPIVLIIAIPVAIAAIVLLLLFGRPLAESVLVSAHAALGVATGVPPWAGAGDDDHVVVLTTPGVDTFSFDADPTATITSAKKATATELATILGGATPPASPTPANEPTPGPVPAMPRSRRRRLTPTATSWRWA